MPVERSQRCYLEVPKFNLPLRPERVTRPPPDFCATHILRCVCAHRASCIVRDTWPALDRSRHGLPLDTGIPVRHRIPCRNSSPAAEYAAEVCFSIHGHWNRHLIAELGEAPNPSQQRLLPSSMYRTVIIIQKSIMAICHVADAAVPAGAQTVVIGCVVR